MNLIQTKTNAMEEIAALVRISMEDETYSEILNGNTPRKTPAFLTWSKCTNVCSAGLFASFSLQTQQLNGLWPHKC